MRGIKCRDCEEYRNEWCEKVIDSPHPDMIRDCQYYHEKDPDVIKVTRCKDCVYSRSDVWLYANRPATVECYCARTDVHIWPNDFCSKAERREEGEQNDE